MSDIVDIEIGKDGLEVEASGTAILWSPFQIDLHQPLILAGDSRRYDNVQRRTQHQMPDRERQKTTAKIDGARKKTERKNVD
ncbi:hypothetical protein MAR_001159 [Mya arenaria]|uniref:Uncharacterized protein n=1 Tax=Mya arenaria TaxID=6604 RepID=A0ABY7FED9_MYAAR|nr:hypothetical protein MAR_001159 [Mya arenaria]